LGVEALLAAEARVTGTEGVERLALTPALPYLGDPGLLTSVIDAPRDVLAVEPVAVARRGEDRRIARLDAGERRPSLEQFDGRRDEVQSARLAVLRERHAVHAVPVPVDAERLAGEVEIVPVEHDQLAEARPRDYRGFRDIDVDASVL